MNGELPPLDEIVTDYVDQLDVESDHGSITALQNFYSGHCQEGLLESIEKDVSKFALSYIPYELNFKEVKRIFKEMDADEFQKVQDSMSEQERSDTDSLSQNVLLGVVGVAGGSWSLLIGTARYAMERMSQDHDVSSITYGMITGGLIMTIASVVYNVYAVKKSVKIEERAFKSYRDAGIHIKLDSDELFDEFAKKESYVMKKLGLLDFGVDAAFHKHSL